MKNLIFIICLLFTPIYKYQLVKASDFNPRVIIRIGEDGQVSQREILPPTTETHTYKHHYLLKVLSYNVHGLPGIFAPDGGRAAQIGKILGQRNKEGNAPDVVVLQESFTLNRTNEIFTNSKYKTLIRGENGAFLKLNNGLVFMTNLKTTFQKYHHYNFCYSHDCMSDKGAQLVRVNIPNLPTPIEIYNTHLNSNLDMDVWSDPAVPADVRFGQIQELREFIQNNSPSQYPIIFAADLNIHSHDDEYLLTKEIGPFNSAYEFCLRKKNCQLESIDLPMKYKTAIDHQLYRSGTSPQVKITPVKIIENFQEHFNGKELSDHNGIEVHYKIEWD